MGVTLLTSCPLYLLMPTVFHSFFIQASALFISPSHSLHIFTYYSYLVHILLISVQIFFAFDSKISILKYTCSFHTFLLPLQANTYTVSKTPYASSYLLRTLFIPVALSSSNARFIFSMLLLHT